MATERRPIDGGAGIAQGFLHSAYCILLQSDVLYDNQPEALVSSEVCHVVVITNILTEWLENLRGI